MLMIGILKNMVRYSETIRINPVKKIKNSISHKIKPKLKERNNERTLRM